MDTIKYKNNDERYLKNKLLKLKNRKEELLKTRCKEIDHISTDFNISRTDCQYIRNAYDDYCRQSCRYFKEEILPVEEEMQALRESDNN